MPGTTNISRPLKLRLNSYKQWVENQIGKPTREIAEYRWRFGDARRELVRKRLQDLVAVINFVVNSLAQSIPKNNEKVTHEHWPALVNGIAEVERLAGNQIPRVGRWSDLYRHLRFAEGCDVHDIANLDWPSVRSDIEAGLYSELEPVPVSTEDLTTLVQAEPTGTVTTKLNWEAINAEEFERLLFNLVSDTEEYVNPQWLMRTNAADRSRDLSAERVIRGELSGIQHQRVMIQAKHWKKSIRPIDVYEALTGISAWEPPVIQVLIIATSGWFTSDAVAYIEKHNNEGKRPQIDMWPESHLELLLARRPHLVSEFNLRQ